MENQETVQKTETSKDVVARIDTSDIKNWDDLELCLAYQAGLEKALTVIMERYHLAIYDYAHKLKRKFPSSMRYTFDEFRNEVVCCLIDSLQRFDITRLDPTKPYNIRTFWELEIGKFNHNSGWAYVSSKKREFMRTEQDNIEDYESNRKRKADQMSFKASNKVLDNLIEKEFMKEWFSILTDVEKQVFELLLATRKPKLSKAIKQLKAPKFVKKSLRHKFNELMRKHPGMPIP